MKTLNTTQYAEFVAKGCRDADDKPMTIGDALGLGAMGISGEAGEVTDEIKKHIYHGKELDREALVKELGDTLWYLVLVAICIGVDLTEVVEANVAKLEERHPERYL